MVRFNNEQVGSAIWLVIGIIIALNAHTYELGTLAAPESGLMPFLAGLAICAFAFIGFVHGTLQHKRGIGWKPVLQGSLWQKSFIVFIALLCYALFLTKLGFLLCTMIFLGFLFRTVKPMKWRWVILGSILFSLGAFAIFQLWLKAQLPKGLLGF